MIIKDVFDRICLVSPVPEAVFRLHLDSTVRDLTVRYGEKYTAAPQDEIPLRQEYENALYMGILARITGKNEHEDAYYGLANGAYYRVWHELERKRRREEKGDDV
ncbi:MAG: hypothetical protein E7599_06900 [Ruminococcaceae bacterium]|nr:hypothetical protein [Oscillospiraceae bacterium]